MEFRREKYLQALKNRMHNGLIKVITGIRRCGKSYLVFNIFQKYLLDSGVAQEQIITMAFDERKNKEYRDPDKLLVYVESKITEDKRYYLLLDEVQMLRDFEEALNSLLHISKLDIYVTGSNSKFLSKDIITEFRGRGDEVHVYPLTFKEFMECYPDDVYHGWADYITYGGLPLVAAMPTEEQKAAYLERLFEETYLKDIVEHNHLEKNQELGDLINVLASSIGSLTNAPKIEATFKSVLHSSISGNTIRKYLEFLKDTFMVAEAQRFDVKGRKYIGTPVKYYFEDVGLRNARLGFRQIEETHLMENVLYNELRARGYRVDVGVVTRRELEDGVQRKKQLEVDFIANMGSKRFYIQSAMALPSAEKLAQEKASLLNIGDSFKKIIVVKDIVKVQRDGDGIVMMNIFDFLLQENSLEL